MKIKNPATGEIIIELPTDGKKEIEAKLKALRRGQREWAGRSVGERLECIVKFGELVHRNVDELAIILTEETGKPIQQSRNEINGAQNRIEHLKNNAGKWLADEVLVDSGATHEKIKYEPL